VRAGSHRQDGHLPAAHGVPAGTALAAAWELSWRGQQWGHVLGPRPPRECSAVSLCMSTLLFATLLCFGALTTLGVLCCRCLSVYLFGCCAALLMGPGHLMSKLCCGCCVCCLKALATCLLRSAAHPLQHRQSEPLHAACCIPSTELAADWLVGCAVGWACSAHMTCQVALIAILVYRHVRALPTLPLPAACPEHSVERAHP